jgi:hypothetical protein
VYKITAKSAAGCSSPAVTDTVVVSATKIPTIAYTGSTSFCLYDSLVLTTTAAGALQWYRDNGSIKQATTGRYVVKTGGWYKVAATGSGGCAAISPDSVFVTVTQVPRPTITLVGDSLYSSSPTGNQWYEDDATIPGDTSNAYAPVNIDVYTVQVTSAGCVSPMSDPFVYTAGTLGYKDKITASSGNVKVLLYPNPAQNAANLRLSGFTGGVIVTVTDMAGKVVWQQDKLTNSTYTLPLANLASGVYIVTVKDRTGIRALKLVKAK